MSPPQYPNVCPKCKAKPYRSCRTTSGTDRTTDTHRARIDEQFSDPRYRPILEGLKAVYGEHGSLPFLAYDMSRKWGDIVESAFRYPDEDGRREAALEREVHQRIWNWMPGGTTAEIAARAVKDELAQADLWFDKEIAEC